MSMGQQKSLFIALPIYGAVDSFFVDLWTTFVLDPKVPFEYEMLQGDSLIPRARNTLAEHFLFETNCSHLLFIDSDLMFTADNVKDILNVMDDDAGISVVGGLYPKKTHDGPIQWVYNQLNGNTDINRPDYLEEVNYIGTGFMCISRKVLQSMIDHCGKDIIFTHDDHPKKTGYDFFRTGVYHYKNGTNRYLSEDWFFCQIAKDLGYKIYAHQKVAMKHRGNALYPDKHQINTLLKQQKAIEDNKTNSTNLDPTLSHVESKEIPVAAASGGFD